MRTKVVGVTQGDRQNVCEKCVAGESLQLVREPTNPADKSAIKVCRADGKQLGYLSGNIAEDLAPAMDRGERFRAEVLDVTGGTRTKPTRGVNIAIYAVAGNRRPAAANKGGCAGSVLLIVLLLVGLVVLAVTSGQ